MIAATLFSGIGAPECAMPEWDWRWCAEIAKFPSAVLAARHPGSVNLGDVTGHDLANRALAIGRPDVLVFGTPCQSFSVAGRRLGLRDPRGNLALHALRLVDAIRPRWFVFENVPGILSSDEGRDFGRFLWLVEQLGYRWAYRTLDAQFFGLAQQRQRVFVVGYLGDWRGPASVLFEPSCLRRDFAPRRKTGKDIAGSLGGSSQSGGFRTTDLDNQGAFIVEPPEVAWALQERDAKGVDSDTKDGHLIVCQPVADPLVAKEGETYTHEGKGNFRMRNVIAFSCKDYGNDVREEQTPTLRAMGFDGSHSNAGGQLAIAFQTRIARNGRGQPSEIAPALNGADAGATSDMRPVVAAGTMVRRLTPRECERLQGFADDYTLIKYRGKLAADAPRYKALGNSMAVPVLRWILSRIETLEASGALLPQG